VRMGKWKGIKSGIEGKIQLYNLEKDIGEENDLADQFPEIVSKIDIIMKKAYVPHTNYPIGEIYTGKPIWKKSN
ncbi:MAG: hypothetical protein R3182_11815, partial [Draconibacterium sp.]|nr:hypothetical protein [Draconibacterium sp.]